MTSKYIQCGKRDFQSDGRISLRDIMRRHGFTGGDSIEVLVRRVKTVKPARTHQGMYNRGVQ